jgi:nucleoside-diphosphate-sugar epimerase
MTLMKTAFVTGASGFIGSHLCEELVRHGVTVRALLRKGKRNERLAQLPLTVIEGDLHDRDALERGMKGADAVYHLAALYREAKFGDEMYWKVNFEGTRNILDLAESTKVGYVSYCSTTGVLGHIEHPPADESQPYHPLDVYQESKTEAEKLVLERLRSRVIRGSVIRPTMVWGPYDTRLLKLFKGIARRTLPIVGSGDTWCHWVLVHDLVRAFRIAPTVPASDGQLYIIGGERPVTLRYTMETIAAEYGVKLLPFRVPVLPIQVLGSAVEAICAPFGIEPPLHRRRADFFVKNRSFTCAKASRELGYHASHTFEEEAALVARWYVSEGWISLKGGGRTEAATSVTS